MIKLLADENFDGDILRGLLRRLPSLDVVRVQDVGLSGMLDQDVLDWAAKNDRILLTHDRNTVPGFVNDRVVAGRPMPGVFLVSKSIPKGQAVEELLIAIECSGPEECKDLVRFFPL